MGIKRYLKTGSEFDRGKEVIRRNTDIVQAVNTSVCGHLCLFILKSLTNGEKGLCSIKTSLYWAIQPITSTTRLER